MTLTLTSDVTTSAITDGSESPEHWRQLGWIGECSARSGTDQDGFYISLLARNAIALGGVTEPVHLYRRRFQDAEVRQRNAWSG
jgi:hypothetical protein